MKKTIAYSQMNPASPDSQIDILFLAAENPNPSLGIHTDGTADFAATSAPLKKKKKTVRFNVPEETTEKEQKIKLDLVRKITKCLKAQLPFKDWKAYSNAGFGHFRSEALKNIDEPFTLLHAAIDNYLKQIDDGRPMITSLIELVPAILDAKKCTTNRRLMAALDSIHSYIEPLARSLVATRTKTDTPGNEKWNAELDKLIVVLTSYSEQLRSPFTYPPSPQEIALLSGRFSEGPLFGGGRSVTRHLIERYESANAPITDEQIEALSKEIASAYFNRNNEVLENPKLESWTVEKWSEETQLESEIPRVPEAIKIDTQLGQLLEYIATNNSSIFQVTIDLISTLHREKQAFIIKSIPQLNTAFATLKNRALGYAANLIERATPEERECWLDLKDHNIPDIVALKRIISLSKELKGILGIHEILQGMSPIHSIIE